MTIRTETREQVFLLFCKKVPLSLIASKCKIHPRTIDTWIVKFKWKKLRDELNVFAQKNAKNAERDYENKVLDIAMEQIEKALKKGKVKMALNGIAKIIALRGVRRGEVSERTEVKQSQEEAYQEHTKEEGK